jgi:hypothetical protein
VSKPLDDDGSQERGFVLLATVRDPIEWVMDHRVLYLKDLIADPAPSFMLSLYTFRYAYIGGVGHVAFVRHKSRDDEQLRILSDNLTLAAQTPSRFAPRALLAEFGAIGPSIAVFTSSPILEDQWRIEAEGFQLDAQWLDLEAPVFAYGPSPARPDATDTFSVLRPAGSARAAVNGVRVAGVPYPNDVWTAWMGRALSSCLVAQDEVVVQRRPGAAA